MPTPPLPLFHALLQTLRIPLTPPTISSIPPSLLLLTLESILDARLPITSEIRSCATPSDELMLVKVLMGVMGDDELGMDLSAVDPMRVVMGAKEEMGVMIMALVVIAKRRGLDVYAGLRADRGEGVGDASIESYGSGEVDVMDEDLEDGGEGLDQPLEPDVTVMSPVKRVDAHDQDVFGGDTRHARQGSSGLFMRIDANDTKRGYHSDDPHATLDHSRRHANETRGYQANIYDAHSLKYDELDVGESNIYDTPMPRLNGVNSPEPLMRSREDGRQEYRLRLQAHEARELRDAMAIEKVSSWREDGHNPSSGTSTEAGSGRRRTVLQEMMDEFGLG